MRSPARALTWAGIFRMGLVQTALGAVVVLAISTLNRIMVVEYALPAAVPGSLIALHYLVQLVRPRFGHGTDVGGHRTRWIVGGMAVLALGGTLAALATGLLGSVRPLAFALAVAAYVLIGLGAGAAGTSLLVLLAREVAPERRAGAATLLWTMMIAGFALTSSIVGRFLDPYSPRRLVWVVGCACLAAFLVAAAAVRGVEGSTAQGRAGPPPRARAEAFATALSAVWADRQTRRFTLFVFVSMLAYSAQELLLEPFGGLVFHYTAGASARLSGAMHGGSVLGMLLVAGASSGLRLGSPRTWVTLGCLASAVALALLTAAAMAAPGWPLVPTVFALGVSFGGFAVAAIGSMMELAGASGDGREGVRMGLWGGAQALAFALGGLLGTASVDLLRSAAHEAPWAYSVVFAAEAVLFIGAAWLSRAGDARPYSSRPGALLAWPSMPALAQKRGIQ